MPHTAAVLTVSDGVTEGVREDRSGPALAALLAEHGYDVVQRRVVPDEVADIGDALRALAAGADLVVTTGGTGFSQRDVTPEATRGVIDREAPGLAEAMRAAGRVTTPMADLSRGVCGTLGAALVVNLPGSVKGSTESLAAILPVLPHAVDLLRGEVDHHGPHAARPAD